eukprot:EG_transcript_22666
MSLSHTGYHSGYHGYSSSHPSFPSSYLSFPSLVYRPAPLVTVRHASPSSSRWSASSPVSQYHWPSATNGTAWALPSFAFPKTVDFSTGLSPAASPVDPYAAVLKRCEELRAQGEGEAAIQELEKAASTAQTHVALNERLGALYQEQGKPQQAYETFTRLIALRPGNALYCANLGIAAQGLDHLDVAIRWYREAIRWSPDYTIAHSNLGNCLKLLGQPAVAEAHYRQALAADPNFADAHSNLGNLLKEGGRVEEAIHHYREAIRINPGHASAWSNLGGSYKDSNRVTE